jgi:hypothetical protein
MFFVKLLSARVPSQLNRDLHKHISLALYRPDFSSFSFKQQCHTSQGTHYVSATETNGSVLFNVITIRNHTQNAGMCCYYCYTVALSPQANSTD